MRRNPTMRGGTYNVPGLWGAYRFMCANVYVSNIAGKQRALGVARRRQLAMRRRAGALRATRGTPAASGRRRAVRSSRIPPRKAQRRALRWTSLEPTQIRFLFMLKKERNRCLQIHTNKISSTNRSLIRPINKRNRHLWNNPQTTVNSHSTNQIPVKLHA